MASFLRQIPLFGVQHVHTATVELNIAACPCLIKASTRSEVFTGGGHPGPHQGQLVTWTGQINPCNRIHIVMIRTSRLGHDRLILLQVLSELGLR